MYLSQADHFEHSLFGGIDLHNDVSGNLTVDFSHNGTYSTHLFGGRAVDVIHNHDTDEVRIVFSFGVDPVLLGEWH